jgi:pimeloyl-ACP methyl ester carboxylesterase
VVDQASPDVLTSGNGVYKHGCMASISLPHVQLSYDDVGSGSPPLLLIHGFSCARTDFKYQFDYFSPHHRVVAFDQRGHGDSSVADDGRYGFSIDAQDARAICEVLGLEKPIVVGHSLGGVTASQLAAEPGFASALVLLDSTIELPEEVQGEIVGFVDDLERSSDEAFRERVGQYARYRMIEPSDDPVIVEQLMERSMSVPKDVYVAGVRSIIDGDVLQTALAVDVPTLFIASSLPWIDPGRIHELRPTWFIGRTVGAGHFHHLLAADQVNAMIDRFLSGIERGITEAPSSDW